MYCFETVSSNLLGVFFDVFFFLTVHRVLLACAVVREWLD